MSRFSPCPYPLLAADENIDTTIYVGYTNCVVPCPSIVFTHEEWNRALSVLQVLSFVSCCLSLMVLFGHICDMDSKKYIRTMFIGGFSASSAIISIFLFSNVDDAITCNGDLHYVEKSTLCVIQAFLLIFAFTWVSIWALIFSYDVYCQILSLTPHYDSSPYHRKYTIIASSISLTLALIPLIAGKNVSFSS
jgi:hypothetical protein